ncbi:MAG: hypothetical protein V4671_14545 [Armatimonadota bacterium]
MTCPPLEILSDLLDDALPRTMRWQVRRHVNQCSTCARQLAAETRLRDQVRTATGKVTAPVGLRESVFNASKLSPHDCSTGRRLTDRRLTDRHLTDRRSPMLLATALCSVLAVLAAWLLRPVVVPPPAFAEVMRAMEKVHTARWQFESRQYDVRTKKTYQYRRTYAARFNPPALATISGAYNSVIKPDHLKVEQKNGFRVYTDFRRAFFAVEQDPAATAESVVRRFILYRILAPRDTGKGSAAWISRRETVQGRELLRFDRAVRERVSPQGTQQSGSTRPPRVSIPPDTRYTVWADPVTLRVVRTEGNGYDGQGHSRSWSTNYEYDIALPPSTFVEQTRGKVP